MFIGLPRKLYFFRSVFFSKDLVCLLLGFCLLSSAVSLAENSYHNIDKSQITTSSIVSSEGITPVSKKEESSAAVQVAKAHFIVLDKITTKRYELVVPSGESVKVGNLLISVLECWQFLDPSTSDNAVLFNIAKQEPSGTISSIFKGWIFSAYPGHDNLEDKTYLIAVIKCFSD